MEARSAAESAAKKADSTAGKNGATLTNEVSGEKEAERKQKVQALIRKFVIQLKQGCNKKVCFAKFCQKNIFGKSVAPWLTHAWGRNGEFALRKRQGDVAVRPADHQRGKRPRRAHLQRHGEREPLGPP